MDMSNYVELFSLEKMINLLEKILVEVRFDPNQRSIMSC